jgi:pimeloyl-ACP methyl ester carboxylesterase
MYAGQYPDEVSGLVLLDSSHPDQWSSTAAGKAQYETNARLYGIAPWLARMGVMRVMGNFQPDSGLPAPQSGALRASFAATKDWDAQSAEFLASPSTNDQVRGIVSLGDLPLFVLTGTEHGTPPDQEELWQSWQKDLAMLSTNSVQQVVTGADHAASCAGSCAYRRTPEITPVFIFVTPRGCHHLPPGQYRHNSRSTPASPLAGPASSRRWRNRYLPSHSAA